jgi:hypothetical protein
MEAMTMAILGVWLAVALFGVVFFSLELRAQLGALSRGKRAHLKSGAPVADLSRLAMGACLAFLLFCALYVVAHLVVAIVAPILESLGDGVTFTAISLAMPSLDLARLRFCPDEDGRLPLAAFAFPGGYPIIYYCDDGATLCPSCANEEDSDRYASDDDDDGFLDSPVVSFFLNYEDVVFCDACGAAMYGAYVEEEAAEFQPESER